MHAKQYYTIKVTSKVCGMVLQYYGAKIAPSNFATSQCLKQIQWGKGCLRAFKVF